MNWLKKTVFVAIAMFILFALIQAFGAGLFAVEFLGFGGLMTLVALGIIELNTVTYE